MTRLVAAVVGIVLLAPPLAAQFKSGIAIVRVDALVTDRRRPVAGLTADQFELLDNGVRQTITGVQYEKLPLNVVCVLDLSGSIAGQPLEHLRQGYLAVVDALRAEDRATLITFSAKATLHAALTGDKGQLRWLADHLTSEGATSLFDAVFGALALREAGQGRTLVLLLSDGRDTSSFLTARQVVDAAQRTDAVVYPVSVKAPSQAVTRLDLHVQDLASPAQRAAEQFFDALADDTGGRVVSADRDNKLAATLLAILTEFRERYVLSYSPSGVPAGGWHPLTVRVKGRDLTVKARRGYAMD